MMAIRRKLFKCNIDNFFIGNNCARLFSTVFKTDENVNRFEEVKIPVPWGHVAAKWWGPQDKRPILVLHGWQDNSGSFDTLIPQLPKSVSYLAIDFPGHGHSTQIPKGMFYHFMNGPIFIRQLIETFKWPKVTLLGHSLGAIFSFTYGSLFPETIDFMMCLDGLNPLIFDKRIDRTVKSINEFVKYDRLNSSSNEPPSYTIAEMEQILHNATKKSIDLGNCKYILERNILPSVKHPGKFYFARDARLKTGPLLGWTDKDVLEASSRVKFPILLAMCDHSPFFKHRKQADECLQIVEKNSCDYEFHIVNGTHHAHLNKPEEVSKILYPFIEKYGKEDRTFANNVLIK